MEMNYDQDTIDKFLQGELDEKMEKEFKARLEVDKALAEEVNAHTKALDILESLGDLEMKARIQKIHNQQINQSKSSTKRIELKKWFAIAAAISFLLFGTWWFGLRSPQNIRLFAQNYETYKLNFGSRSSQENDLLIEASIAYKQKDYSAALNLFNQIPDTNEYYSNILLAKGICLMELDKNKEALPIFQQLIQSKDALFEEHATWYTALIYLKQNELEQSKSLLAKIADEDGDYYQEKAQEILSALE